MISRLIGCVALGEHALVEEDEAESAGAVEDAVAAALPGLRVVRVSFSAQTAPEDLPAVIAGAASSAAPGRTRRASLSKAQHPQHLPLPQQRRQKGRSSAGGGGGLPAGVAHLRIAHVVFIERLRLVNRPAGLLQALADVLARRTLPLHGSSIAVPAEAFSVFLVLSPQHPPLPPQLLDHFMLRVRLSAAAAAAGGAAASQPIAVRELAGMRERVAQMHVDVDVRQYMREIVVRLRNHEHTAPGAVSPRAVRMLERAACIAAVLDGDAAFLTPSHVLRVAQAVLAHRVLPQKASPDAADLAEDIVLETLRSVAAPV